MERWLDFVVVFGGLYAIYFFTLRRWDYTTEAKRRAQKDELKRQGLSNAYYFTGAWKLFIYIFCTGGIYAFYWLYKQWKSVAKGYLNTARQPLKGWPVWRALFGAVTFYQLAGIINRTCLYMHKRPSMAAWFSGTVWIICVAGSIILPGWYKLVCLAIFAAVAARLQYRLNALTGKEVPNLFQITDIIPAGVSLLAGGCLWAGYLWKTAFISF